MGEMVPGVGIKGVRIISGSLKKTNIKEQVAQLFGLPAVVLSWKENAKINVKFILTYAFPLVSNYLLGYFL